LTEKGILRAEEMSYYLAEIDLGKKLTVDRGRASNDEIRYHCFPSRTVEQVLRWEGECGKYVVDTKTKGGKYA
jgi:hypothetical protein